MEIEKHHEIKWSIKRKNQAEKFILHLNDLDGKLNVGVGVEHDKTQINFAMDYSEFINFYGLLTSFKELIENTQQNNIPSLQLQTQIPSEDNQQENNLADSNESEPMTDDQTSSLREVQEERPIEIGILPKAQALPESIPITSGPSPEEIEEAQEIQNELDSLEAIDGALNELSDKFNVSKPKVDSHL